MTERNHREPAFTFRDYPALTDGEITPRLLYTAPGDPALGRAPVYSFGIYRVSDGEKVGDIDLRIGSAWAHFYYAGHIGYTIYPPFRGNRYAEKACLLARQVLRDHGITEVWITNNPDNWPSRITCERIGAELVETVDTPDSDMHQRGQLQKCRYRWNLEEEGRT